jgi:glycosyltransferase involved in cell wall biosynthesis
LSSLWLAVPHISHIKDLPLTNHKMQKTLISIVTPCFNEEQNVEELAQRIKIVMKELNYDYEHIFIDNASSDSTVEKIKRLCQGDQRIKLIVNTRNFGHLKSPYYGVLQATGVAAILMVSDLQDPPELIPSLIQKWEMGFKTVLIVKRTSDENKVMFLIRRLYYKFLSYVSEVPVISNAHGSGLYDRVVIDQLIKINDSYPYLRGILCELGYPIGTVDFDQPRRLRGITKNNFYTLLDAALLGLTNQSKLPLRIMTLSGFFLSFFFVLCAFIFLILKLVYWNQFNAGIAPLLIGLFFMGSGQLFFLGLIGEYVGSIHTQIRNLPLVIERERVNFE